MVQGLVALEGRSTEVLRYSINIYIFTWCLLYNRTSLVNHFVSSVPFSAQVQGFRDSQKLQNSIWGLGFSGFEKDCKPFSSKTIKTTWNYDLKILKSTCGGVTFFLMRNQPGHNWRLPISVWMPVVLAWRAVWEAQLGGAVESTGQALYRGPVETLKSMGRRW